MYLRHTTVTRNGTTRVYWRLVRSVRKEQAMRERFVQRIEEGLAKIEAACQRRACDVGTIERRVGRLLGKYTRAAGLFTVTVERGDAVARM